MLLLSLFFDIFFFLFFTFKQRGHTFSWQKLLKSTAVSGELYFPSLRGHYGQMDLLAKTYSNSVNKYILILLLLAFLQMNVSKSHTLLGNSCQSRQELKNQCSLK